MVASGWCEGGFGDLLDDEFVKENESIYETSEEIDALGLYLRDTRKTKLLTASEEKELAKKSAAGDRAARNKMIEANLRLVVYIAKQYSNRGMSLLDLIGVGNIGLVKAVDLFKVEMGYRFSSYAVRGIRDMIEKEIRINANTVSVSRRKRDRLAWFSVTVARLTKESDQAPEVDELVAELFPIRLKEYMGRSGNIPTQKENDRILKESKKEIMLLYKLMQQRVQYYNDEIGYHNGTDEGHWLETMEDAIYRQQLRDKVVPDLLAHLSDIERKVLRLRFGFDQCGEEKMTLPDVGRQCGFGGEYARQVEAKALATLRGIAPGMLSA